MGSKDVNVDKIENENEYLEYFGKEERKIIANHSLKLMKRIVDVITQYMEDHIKDFEDIGNKFGELKTLAISVASAQAALELAKMKIYATLEEFLEELEKERD